jgi:hypothetical protein
LHEKIINNTTACNPSNSNSIFATTVKKPALGPSFSFLTDATLWLSTHSPTAVENAPEDDDGSTIHVAEVFRSKTTVISTGIPASGLRLTHVQSVRNPGAPSKYGRVFFLVFDPPLA